MNIIYLVLHKNENKFVFFLQTSFFKILLKLFLFTNNQIFKILNLINKEYKKRVA